MSTGNAEKTQEKPMFVSKWDCHIGRLVFLKIEAGARFGVFSCILVYNVFS
jgi:hypothetical protein